MRSYPIFRRASKVIALSAGAVLIPAALEAGCNISYNPITKVETYTCCSDYTCCTTRWVGTRLVENTCAE